MSFFENLLNNAVTSGAGLMSDYVMRQRQLEDEQRREEMAVERQRQMEQNRLTMQEEALNRQRKMTADEMTQVDEQAPAVTRARQLAEAQQQAPSLDAEGMNVVMQNLSPEDLKKYYGVDTSPTAALRDQLGVARKGGMYNAESKLEAMYKEAVQTLSLARQDRVADSQIEANKALAGKRNADAAAKPDETEADLIRADAAKKRAERPAGGGGKGSAGNPDALFKTHTAEDGKVYGITRGGGKVDLGITSDALNRSIANYIIRKSTDDPKFGRLPIAEQRRQAREVITGVVEDAPTATPTPAPTAKPAPGGAGWGMRRLDGGK